MFVGYLLGTLVDTRYLAINEIDLFLITHLLKLAIGGNSPLAIIKSGFPYE